MGVLYINYFILPLFQQCLFPAPGFTEEDIRLPCDVCGKSFGSMKSLRYHYAVHTGRTECALCGKIMSRVSHLKAHMINVHNTQLV
jgi:hypothetical protein